MLNPIVAIGERLQEKRAILAPFPEPMLGHGERAKIDQNPGIDR